MSWYRAVIAKLESARLFAKVDLVGGKVRATVDSARFLDIHSDPTTSSYSYAFIDETLSVPGDKRLFGWDDFPHTGVESFQQLKSYPHHFQKRMGRSWVFEESPMRGDVENEIDIVIDHVRQYLKSH